MSRYDAGHAVGDHINVITFGSEVVLKDEPERRIVFDDEDTMRQRSQQVGRPIVHRVPTPNSLSTVSVPP
jgi:hypothetical protein